MAVELSQVAEKAEGDQGTETNKEKEREKES